MRWLFALLLAAPALAQSPADSASVGWIAGRVTSETGEPLLGANVFVPELEVGAATDVEGVFTFEVPEGTHTVLVSYIGFVSQEIEVMVAAGATAEIAPALASQGDDLGCEFVICTDAPLLVRTPYQARVIAGAAQDGWCTTLPPGGTFARGR